VAKRLRTAAPQILIAYALLKGPKGSKILRLAIDTGATKTLIPLEAAIPIGCDPSKSRRRATIITASGLEYLPVVTLREIVCLGQSIRSFEAACHDLPPQSTVDGLLGLDFLSRLPAFRRFRGDIVRLTQE